MPEILIIDDDPQMRRLIARILKRAGHVVHEAPEGGLGVELFRRVRPALVVTDLVMPGQEGIETIRELRSVDATIPILAISGGDNPIYLCAATGLGATAALQKPFGSAEFLAVVGELLAPG